jgi:hypothetical protein
MAEAQETEKTVISHPTEAKVGDKINVDGVFDACALLVTVLAAVELAYAAYLFPATEASGLAQINYYFRVTTTVIIALIVGWIIARLIPSPPQNLRLGALRRFRRRYVKEFCWCLFGNLFVFEIIAFVYYGFFNGELTQLLTIYYGMFFAFFLTLPATWLYSRMDGKPNRSLSLYRLRLLIPIAEHLIVFIIAYLVLQQVMLFSGSVPVPVSSP